MTLNPNLDFDGQCEAAFRAYAAILNAKITHLSTYRQHRVEIAPHQLDHVFHAVLMLGDRKLSGNDVVYAPYRPPQGFTIQLDLDDAAEAGRIFSALSEGGTTVMPLQPTLWAKQFAVFVDRFRIPWKINCI